MSAISQDALRSMVTTGIPGLDEVLGGGIPQGSTVFVTGLPGAGKTILCEQAVFENARRDGTVLYLTTLSEPPMKMLQFSRHFTFFDPGLIERQVFYKDLGETLRNEGVQGALAAVERAINEHRPGLVVLDSFKVFREHFGNIRDLRAFTAELDILFATWEVTSLLVGEYPFEDIVTQPEFAIADGILHLMGIEEVTRQKRFLNVVKMRGARAFLGRHSYEINENGVTVYPRMLPRVQSDYVLSDERVGSAVVGMNKIMGGGIPRGSVGLISGGTGSGKTITALSFAIDAARQGVPALFISFEESPNQLLRNCQRLGWEAETLQGNGRLTFAHISPSELDIDRHAIMVKRRAEASGAKLIVIDSITAFDIGADRETTIREYLWGISDYFKRQGVTLIFTMEAYSPFEATARSNERAYSYFADAIILLRLVEDGEQVRRKISILKVRGSRHDTRLHELLIDANGVRLQDDR